MQVPVRVKQVVEVALRTGVAFGRDRCSIAAGGITYFALISIFPLALVALSVGGFMLENEADRQDFIDSIIDEIPLDEESGAEDLEDIIVSIANARGTLGIFGILGALYTGSALFTAVRLALNGVFGGEKLRSFFAGKAIDIGLVMVFALLLFLSIAATFAITFIVGVVDEIVPKDAEAITRFGLVVSYFVIPPAISTATFLLLYAIVPAQPVPWRAALPGVMVATVVFEALKVGFSWYVASFGNYNATYGSLGFIIILLFFIYLSAQVMLLGAEVARATHEVRSGWPFAASDSQFETVAAKLRSLRARLLRRGESAATPIATGDLSRSAVSGPEPRASLAGDGHEARKAIALGSSSQMAAQPTPVSWMVTAFALAGIYVLAYLGIRRR